MGRRGVVGRERGDFERARDCDRGRGGAEVGVVEAMSVSCIDVSAI